MSVNYPPKPLPPGENEKVLQETSPSEPGLVRYGPALRSLLRLGVGGIDLALGELERGLQAWEAKASRGRQEQALQRAAGSEEAESVPDSLSQYLRFAVIGMLFEAQARLVLRASQVDRVTRLLGQMTDPWLRPLADSRWLRLARRSQDALVERGEEVVAHWVATGRREATRSRRLAEIAFKTTVDYNIDYLTNNPEVQELVQTQSTGLANEVIEEVRERTVSADSYLEGVARSLFHRLPRRALPEPPLEVRQRAAGFHPPKKKRPASP